MTFTSPLIYANIETACSALTEALLHRDYDRYLVLESVYYNQIVKINETEAHYELCFSSLDAIDQMYGDVLGACVKDVKPDSVADKRSKRICYLLPNIDNDLAHIEFLYHVLKHHTAESDLKITIAGYSVDSKPPASRLLTRLASEGKVSLLKIPDNHVGRVRFSKFFIKNSFSQLIVFSIPLQVSSWVRALTSKKVTWVTSKFELSAFSELENKVSFAGDGVSEMIAENGWFKSPLSLSREAVAPFSVDDRPRTRLVTVNRTEKMRSREFLSAVCSILKSEPSSTFAWTGRARDPIVQDVFDREGLSDRCSFIGWVEPRSTLASYDIFLDTFGLSGLVAATAFASGMPTVFFKGSRAFVEFYERFLTSESGLHADAVLAPSVEHYVDVVVSLIRDHRIYLSRARAQARFADEVLFNEKLMYNAHVECLRRIIDRVPVGVTARE